MKVTNSGQPRSYLPPAGRSILRFFLLVSFVLGSFSIPTPAEAALANPQQASVLLDGPLPLPASFYGEIHLTPAPLPGAVIQVHAPGVSAAIASTVVELNDEILTYALDVPGDNPDTPAKDGALAGDWITFSVSGTSTVTAPWVSGTNTQVNFTTLINPPPLPDNFYGEIHASPTQPAPGTPVQARIAGLSGTAAATVVVQDGSSLVYSLDVPADDPNTPVKDGAMEGDLVTFSVAGIEAGTAAWHSGGHTRLDLTYSTNPPPLPATFYGEIHFSPTPPAVGTVIEARIAGISGVSAATVVAQEGTTLVYLLDIPADNPDTPVKDGAVEGDMVTLSVGGVEGGTTAWHSGVHIRLDLIYPIIPPPLPATFYGEIHFFPTQPAVGTVIEARIAGISGAAAATVVEQDGTTLIYHLTIPADLPDTTPREGGAEGDLITFYLGGRAVASAVWHGGSHTRLDFIFFEIILQPGWNLVSFNVHPTDTAIDQVLSSITNLYDQVYVWDASVTRENWLFYSPDVPPFVNTLYELDETRGFWVHVTAQTQVPLIVTGSLPTTTTINLYTNAGRWNLVGYPALLERPLPGAIPAQVAQVDAYYAWDPDPWKIYDRILPPFAISLESLTPGWGYWVYVTSPVSWNVTYP